MNAQEIRDQAMALAIEYGYVDGIAPFGKFEGEPFYALYFYDQAMNGCGEPLYQGMCEQEEEDDCADSECIGDIFQLTDLEREAFMLGRHVAAIMLEYSTQGFVRLVELTAKQAEELQS